LLSAHRIYISMLAGRYHKSITQHIGTIRDEQVKTIAALLLSKIHFPENVRTEVIAALLTTARRNALDHEPNLRENIARALINQPGGRRALQKAIREKKFRPQEMKRLGFVQMEIDELTGKAK
ncbi:hypothetical protein KKC60_04110, partial [Patescibacteria group bacterium]|nr:hypothetical protein [Patescibacteria group bacterium]